MNIVSVKPYLYSNVFMSIESIRCVQILLCSINHIPTCKYFSLLWKRFKCMLPHTIKIISLFLEQRKLRLLRNFLSFSCFRVQALTVLAVRHGMNDFRLFYQVIAKCLLSCVCNLGTVCQCGLAVFWQFNCVSIQCSELTWWHSCGSSWFQNRHSVLSKFNRFS